MRMRVLYICGVGPFGGASRSLYEAVKALPKESVEAYFIGVHGSALTLYKEVATDLVATIGMTRFDNSRYSHYRGMRWVVLLRELWYLPFTLVAILRAKLRWGHVDVIHGNEIMGIVPLLIAKRVFRAPIVVHVRSLVRVEERSRRCKWLSARLVHDADAVIAIDNNVRATLPAEAEVDVIHNSFSFKQTSHPDQEIVRKLKTLRSSSLKVGFSGNLQQCKGLFDLLEAAKIVRAADRDVEFIIVGGGTSADRGLKAWVLGKLGLSQAVKSTLTEAISRSGLSDSFHLLGHTREIQYLYENIDVLCFPSHLDAPGRPVFEAAFFSVPSITAVTNPRPDTLVPGETGLAVPGEDPAKLAEAILYFADNRGEIQRMGANAKRLAEKNFKPDTNAAKLLGVYRRVLQTAGHA
jgi:glycosyltransferase involved in cell wall biosynthesis